jgi:hypothetical protein
VQHAGAFDGERNGGRLGSHDLHYKEEGLRPPRRSQLFSIFHSGPAAFLFNWLKDAAGGV